MGFSFAGKTCAYRILSDALQLIQEWVSAYFTLFFMVSSWYVTVVRAEIAEKMMYNNEDLVTVKQ